jgi:GDP-L-fucose synthase
LAAAGLFLLERYDNRPLNIGGELDVSIRSLAEIDAEVIQFDGEIDWGTSKPDGMPGKTSVTAQVNQLGWSPTIELEEEICFTYKWFKDQSLLNENLRL